MGTTCNTYALAQLPETDVVPTLISFETRLHNQHVRFKTDQRRICNMDTLPTEILELIVEHCDHASLKSLRLVNKEWQRLTTPGVFEHFYMGLFDHCLHNLCLLSKSPLAKYVKKFTFYCDPLPEWSGSTGAHCWKLSIDYTHEAGLARSPFDGMNTPISESDSQRCHSFSYEQLKHGYDQFQVLRQQQRNWRHASTQLAFKEHFAMLPSVAEATLTYARSNENVPANALPVWKGLRQRMCIGPDNWEPFGAIICGAPDSMPAMISMTATMCLLEAIGFRSTFVGTNPITRLNAAYLCAYGDSHFSASWGQTPYGREPAMIIKDIRQTFQHLTHLSVREPSVFGLQEVDFGDEETLEYETARFIHILEWSRLPLRAPVWPEPSGLLPRPGWPMIKHLQLSVLVHFEVLKRFLSWLSPTLRSLELLEMCIPDPNELIIEIPKILKLEHVFLQKIWARGSLRIDVMGHCWFREGTDIDALRPLKAFLLRQSNRKPDFDVS